MTQSVSPAEPVSQPAGQALPTAEAPSGRLPPLIWGIAATFVALELAASNLHGFGPDELYFIEAGRHLGFGYVDQPPFAPLLTRITGVLGVSPAAIRIAPALAGGFTVAATARLAALFRAGRLGQVLAAVIAACAPFTVEIAHYADTTAYDVLAWTLVFLCVSTALLRDRPRWWLGAGVAAGAGMQDENLMAMLVLCLAIGIVSSQHRDILRTRWPWLGAGIAAAIWAPNAIWQAAHGWPQLAMASALHQEFSTPVSYSHGALGQVFQSGLLVVPVAIAGFIGLWRDPRLRFCAVTVTLVVTWVLLWIPGKVYYTAGTLPAVVACGSAAAQRWVGRGGRPHVRRRLLVAAPLIGLLLVLPVTLSAGTVGWPQFAAAVAAQDSALTRAGERPSSVFTWQFAQAAALEVLGDRSSLPPVLSGHNTYWMWGPGNASDRVVLVVGAFGQLEPYFGNCRVLATYYPPPHARTTLSGLQIGVCTDPAANWRALWPHLKHYSAPGFAS